MTPTAATPPKLKPNQKRVYSARVKDVEGDHPLHADDWWTITTASNPDGQFGTRAWAEDALERAKSTYTKGRLMGHVYDEVITVEPTLETIDVLTYLKGDVVLVKDVPKDLQAQYRDTLRRCALAAYRAGVVVHVNESFRTRKQQEHFWALYLKGGNLAAYPGTSPHEKGIGLDVQNARDIPKFIRECRKLGLIDDVASEKWHLTNHHRVA